MFYIYLAKILLLLVIYSKVVWEKCADTKWVIRSRKSKDRQHNGQKKHDKRTNNDLQSIKQNTKDRATRNPLKQLYNDYQTYCWKKSQIDITSRSVTILWYIFGNLNTRKCDSTLVCVVMLVASVQPHCMVKHLSAAARKWAVMYMCVRGHVYVC